MRRPDFFIVGAPKCGTTALYEYLRTHPEIFLPRRKEPHYFGRDLRMAPSKRVTDAEEYLRLFAEAGSARRVGESSVWYFYSWTAPEEIEAFSGNCSIIIMLRDPVEMIYSNHSQLVYKGHEDIRDFKDALAAEDDRKHGRRLPSEVFLVESLLYRQLGQYSSHVARYLEVFGEERIHVIVYDDLLRDAAAVYQKCLSFLGVGPDSRSLFDVVNPNRSPRWIGLKRFCEQPPVMLKRIVGVLLSPGTRAKLGKRLEWLYTSYSPRPALEPVLRRKLRHEFAADVARLSELLGRDLSHWTRGETVEVSLPHR